ncbi:2-nitropropane dioxygenase family protein [Sphingobium sp. SYK-6]|uniref:NAD(P)H-dependent flavin oxidoreductase n=1 Tax=Sphingobium sp. (strain NBRC 103272 / SYK-6) TaxID=627192 RepID=UPI0002277D43|nr:nitronate monooxygenase family protein [Sphingobium sp. SYK-6]BAK68329.1 2-nitropropane dioxygenase family protein [Sphingobium sp. SYK-6]
MPIPKPLDRGIRLPVIGAPLFIISNPDLVIAQCKAGIIGAMPSLNAREPERLEDWLARIHEALAAHDAANPESPAAPYAVNLIVHRSNPRLMEDLAICARFKVPLVITSLGANTDVNAAVHEWGGLVFHDVINQRFAHKAVEKGADGLILVGAGAGGHAGAQSPFALMAETRAWFDGPIALSGAISTGAGILAAQAMGADFAYIGSAFIATDEARAAPAYKQGIVSGAADDIVYSSYFTGVPGNYLRGSITAQGLDPDNLPARDPSIMDFGAASGAKAWRDIWGAGQGIGSVREIVPAAQLIERLSQEHLSARQRLCG